jgi:ribonuclease HI
MTYHHIKVYTDGGSRGNPGPSASGIVLLTPEHKLIEAFGVYLGETTNNQAECRAVLLAIEAALKYGVKKLDFYMDSMLVCKQLLGEYKIKNEALKPIYEQIWAYTKDLEVTYQHVYREFNKLADEQVNIAIDKALGYNK